MPRTERSAKRTVDHDEIRQWVEAHGGHPAAVKGTGSADDPGILRIDFPGFSGAGKLEELEWGRFFDWFDRNELAFIFQDVEGSRFNKLVRRRPDERPARGEGASAATGEGEHHVNAIRLLEQQHREVEELFDDYENADSGKQQIFEKLADSIAAHGEIEEQIFYPSVLAERTADELREAVEEHLGFKRIIADLLKMKPEDPQFDAKVNVLRELVDHHVEEEENRLFTMVEQLDQETLSSLGEMMETSYEELMKTEPRRLVPKQTGAAAPLPS